MTPAAQGQNAGLWNDPRVPFYDHALGQRKDTICTTFRAAQQPTRVVLLRR
jgi:hypothetical protein